MGSLGKVLTVTRAIFYEMKQKLLSAGNLSTFKREIAHCEAGFHQVSNEYFHIKAASLCLQRDKSFLEESIHMQESAMSSAVRLKQGDLVETITKSIAIKTCASGELSKKIAVLQECQLHLQQVLQVLSKKIQAYRLELHLVESTESAQQVVYIAMKSSAINVTPSELTIRLQEIKLKQQALSKQFEAMALLEVELSEAYKSD